MRSPVDREDAILEVVPQNAHRLIDLTVPADGEGGHPTVEDFPVVNLPVATAT